ncbi:MAG TPA: response regulator [Methylobacter sp.]|jgi:CheY-like chemotaxis protein
MEKNNLQPENTGKHDLRQLRVALLGFESVNEAKLIRVFQIERSDGECRYIAAKPSNQACSDILMVNYDDPAALQEKDRILGAHPQAQVVAVSRGSIQEAPAYHIRGMLIAAKVLNVLDKVSAELRSETASVQSQVVAEKNSPHDQAIVTEKLAAATSACVGGYRVLVVDDSPAIQKSLELNLAILPKIGVIDFADSGESAIEKAETKQYDLIFLDVMMPGIDGYETCTQLRKKPEYKKTPIIMVSGKTSPLDEVKGVMAGCTTYLTKPVQPEAFQKLSSRILAWLENRKKA